MGTIPIEQSAKTAQPLVIPHTRRLVGASGAPDPDFIEYIGQSNGQDARQKHAVLHVLIPWVDDEYPMSTAATVKSSHPHGARRARRADQTQYGQAIA